MKQKESNCDVEPTITINPTTLLISSPRRDSEEEETKMSALRSHSIFPIFNNAELAKLSPNYFLYFQFYHMAIWMLVGVLLFSLLACLVYYSVMYNVSDEDTPKTEAALYCVYIIMVSLVLSKLKALEVKRILKHPLLYDHQWTEDLFSLLVEGLPLDTTKEEISRYFNSLVVGKDISHVVQDIILLQDYRLYVKLKKKIKALDVKIDIAKNKEDNEKQRELLLQNRETMVIQLDTLKDELAQFMHFKGKAIVIFRFIGAKEVIKNYFAMSVFRNLAVSLFRSRYPNYYLRKCRVEVRTIPEPETIIFENLHFSKLQRRFRRVIAYLLSSCFILIAGGIFMSYQLLNSPFIYHQADNPNPEDDKPSIIFAIFVVILKSVSEKIYRYLMSYTIYSSRLDYELRRIDFSIYISFLLYCLLQALQADLLELEFTRQLAKVALVYFLTKMTSAVIIIIAAIIIKKKAKNVKADSLREKIFGYITRMSDKFDFIKGISKSIPILFLAFCFLTQDPLILLPIFIFILFMCALFDKYRMVRLSNPLEIKATRYMLYPLKIFEYASLLPLLAGIFVLQRFGVENSYKSDSEEFQAANIVYCILLIITLVYWPPTLQKQVRSNSEKSLAQVSYESVYQNFSSEYWRVDPMREITKN